MVWFQQSYKVNIRTVVLERRKLSFVEYEWLTRIIGINAVPCFILFLKDYWTSMNEVLRAKFISFPGPVGSDEANSIMADLFMARWVWQEKVFIYSLGFIILNPRWCLSQCPALPFRGALLVKVPFGHINRKLCSIFCKHLFLWSSNTPRILTQSRVSILFTLTSSSSWTAQKTEENDLFLIAIGTVAEPQSFLRRGQQMVPFPILETVVAETCGKSRQGEQMSYFSALLPRCRCLVTLDWAFMGLQNGTPSLPAPELACLPPNKDGSFQSTVIPESCHPRLQQSLEAAEGRVRLTRAGETLKETNSPKACTNMPRIRIVNSHIS